MRILHVTPLPPMRNGIADYAAAYEAALRNVAGLDVIGFGDHFPRSYRHAPVTLAREYRLLARLVATGRFDVIHFESGGSLWKEFLFLFFVSRKPNSALAVTLHDPPTFIDAGYSSRHIVGTEWRLARSLVSRLLVNRMQYSIYHQLDVVFLFSQRGYKSVFQKYRAKDIVIIPLGSMDDMQNRERAGDSSVLEEKSRFRIVLFGFIAAGKGVDVLIQAIHEIVKIRPTLRSRIECIICGDVATPVDVRFREEMKQSVSHLGLRDVIRFAGHIPDEEIAAVMRSADVMVVPHDHTGLYSTSASLIRALCAGVPVIASNARAFPEEVEHMRTGLLFEAGAPSDLADKLLQMYENPELRRALGERAKESAQVKYNWHSICATVVAAYERALARKGQALVP